MAFRAADLGGSGDLEIAVLNKVSTASKKNGAVHVLANVGNGVFSQAAEYAVAKKPKHLRIGDLDGDGSADLVTQGGKAISALFNVGDGFAAALATTLSKAGKALALGDFNNDSLEDLAVVRKDGVQLVPVARRARSRPVSALAPLSTKPQNLVVGDLNGDRVLDLASGVTKKAISPCCSAVRTGSLHWGRSRRRKAKRELPWPRISTAMVGPTLSPSTRNKGASGTS
jgi:hypothetical protein